MNGLKNLESVVARSVEALAEEFRQTTGQSAPEGKQGGKDSSAQQQKMPQQMQTQSGQPPVQPLTQGQAMAIAQAQAEKRRTDGRTDGAVPKAFQNMQMGRQGVPEWLEDMDMESFQKGKGDDMAMGFHHKGKGDMDMGCWWKGKGMDKGGFWKGKDMEKGWWYKGKDMDKGGWKGKDMDKGWYKGKGDMGYYSKGKGKGWKGDGDSRPWNFKTVLCRHFQVNACKMGEYCNFIHEKAGPVMQKGGMSATSCYKTMLCKHYANGNCRHGATCTYAHGVEELQPWGGGAAAAQAAQAQAAQQVAQAQAQAQAQAEAQAQQAAYEAAQNEWGQAANMAAGEQDQPMELQRQAEMELLAFCNFSAAQGWRQPEDGSPEAIADSGTGNGLADQQALQVAQTDDNGYGGVNPGMEGADSEQLSAYLVAQAQAQAVAMQTGWTMAGDQEQQNSIL